MRKSSIIERKKGTKKSQVSTESKDKKSTLIKTTSEIEKELEIPSYDEFRIKDNDSLMDYDDEDIESKMIRLVFLKQKGKIKNNHEEFYEKITNLLNNIRKEIDGEIRKKNLDEFLKNDKSFIIQKLSLINLILEGFNPEEEYLNLKKKNDEIK